MKASAEPVAAWATDCRDKYPENHDSGYAGRLCMADGALAWAAAISDGAGGSLEGLKVSALAIQAFVEAVRASTNAELSDPAARDAWLRGWTKSLHAEAFARFKGGMATFCGAVLLPPVAEGAGWKLFTLNVGDSQVWKLTGDGKCMGVTPDAPPNNANVEGHNPIRVVGVAPKGDFCLLDVEEFPLPAEGPCWILAGSDGFFSKKKGKDELAIFSSGDLRDVCLGSGAPFQELPALAIRRSLANAQKLGAAEMMDNATVAMLGFRVPATDLGRVAVAGAAGPSASAAPAVSSRPPASAAPAASSRPPAPGASAASSRPSASGSQGGDGKGPAAAKRRLAVVAGGALAAGLLLGALLFGGSPPAPAEPAESPSSGLPVYLDRTAVPKRGLCQYCRENKDRLPPGEDPFHWAADCPHKDNWAETR